MKTLKTENGTWFYYSEEAEKYFFDDPNTTRPLIAVTTGDNGTLAMDLEYNSISSEEKLFSYSDLFETIPAVFFPNGNKIIEDYELAKKEVRGVFPTFSKPSEKATGCLLLDRDGIIITDKGYINNPDDCDLIPGVVDLIKWARSKNWKVIVLTNQAGIAKDHILPDELEIVTARVDEILIEHSCTIDKWYFCPYHIDGSVEPWVKQSMDRKPYPGMLLKALNDHDIDPRQMTFIGDKESDLLLVPYLECFLLKGSYPVDEEKYADILHSTYESLNEAVKRRFD